MTRWLRSPLLTIAAGALIPVGVAALLTVWRGQLNTGTVTVVLAGVVLAVAAATGSRSGAIVAAVSATLSFDYFFTVPYDSFTIHETDELVTAIALLFVGLVAATIQTRSLRHAEQAVESSNEISRIGAVTNLIASGEPTDSVIELVRIELIELLDLRGCRYERTPSDPHLARIERTGEVSFGALRWRADRQGLPGEEVELEVSAQGRYGGRFILRPEPGRPVSFDRRIVAVALADQVGASLAMNLIV
jgi:K+-sensing histidine kinase KdpD